MKTQFCIDYLKVRFNGRFIASAHIRLWDLLLLDGSGFMEIPGRSGYRDGLLLDEGLFVFHGGEFTRNSSGEETWLIEMKGKACRNFEERLASKGRGGIDEMDHAWHLLIERMLLEGGICTRVDIPTDDLGGSIPFQALREKIARREYVSRMRRFSVNDSIPADSRSSCDVISSSGGGYTATIGSRESIQLCIYNKKAERESAGYAVNAPSWIRFEARYYHSCAEQVLPLISDALGEGRAPELWLGCLSNIIRFVEKEEGNLSRCPTWGPWDAFIRDGMAKEVRTRARPDMTVRGNARWLEDDASKAMARVAAIHPSCGDDVYSYLLSSGASRITAEDLMIINAERVSSGMRPYGSVADVISSIADGTRMLADVDGRIASLFDKGVSKIGGAAFKEAKKNV